LKGLLTWELTGKEMMISCFTNTNPLPPFCFHPARTSVVVTGNGTCQPAPACPFAFTSTPFMRNLVGRKYHNVLFEVKLFYCIFSALSFGCVVRQHVGEYFTGFANLHFLFPTFLYRPLTDGSVYKPAKIS